MYHFLYHYYLSCFLSLYLLYLLSFFCKILSITVLVKKFFRSPNFNPKFFNRFADICIRVEINFIKKSACEELDLGFLLSE